MTSNAPRETNRQQSPGRVLDIFRLVALIAVAVGGLGSFVLLFRAGQSTPRLLLVLFTFWILAPFAALLWANLASGRWSVVTRAALYCVALIVAPASLAIYSGLIDLKPAGSANAFLWVIVPPVTLVFMAITLPVAALIGRDISPANART
jgi:hypothetical protein